MACPSRYLSKEDFDDAFGDVGFALVPCFSFSLLELAKDFISSLKFGQSAERCSIAHPAHLA